MVKLSKLIMIFDLRRQGLSISAIARKTGLCRQTVRQHLKRGLANPVYGPRHRRPRFLGGGGGDRCVGVGMFRSQVDMTAQTEVGSFDVDHHGMMQEWVQQGSGQPGVAVSLPV